MLSKLKKFRKIITVEDHTIEGGIGSAISEVISNSNFQKNNDAGDNRQIY